jgi:hypothetical protein
MQKLIVCLGYRLRPDNSISPVLQNRLLDVVKLCSSNNVSTLLLMGSSSYGSLKMDKISEAVAMKEFLEKNFSVELAGIKIITEETTKSTVEQMCLLKNFIKKEGLQYSDLIVVSSKFFSDRVKLYAEYVFGTIDGIVFIDSAVSPEMEEEFRKAEEFKLREGKNWLKHHKKGDDRTILKEQRTFQSKVIGGEIGQPPIS